MDFSTEVKIKLQTLILIIFFVGFNFSLLKLQINLHMKSFSLLFEILLYKKKPNIFLFFKNGTP